MNRLNALKVQIGALAVAMKPWRLQPLKRR
jgi:hypothetical protein